MATDVTQRLAAEHRHLAQLVRDTEHQLRTNPAYQPYFAGYSPASVAAFISAYAQRKASYVQRGSGFAAAQEHHAAELHTEAYERLWEIQQKKLFDLQCRWRAKEIELPGVVIYQQFHEWENHPERCPFLPPVTPEEVEVYRAYLLSPACPDASDYYHYLRPDNWQNYADMHLTGPAPDHRDDFYADDEASINNDQPGNLAWYQYYDDHHGQNLLALPDLRGQRQKYYATLHVKDCHVRQAAEKAAQAASSPLVVPPPASAAPSPAYVAALAQAPDPVPDHNRRPMWDHCDWDDLFAEIEERFDPTPGLDALKEAMDAGIYHRDDTNDEARDAFEVLVEARELVPLAAAADWREALVAAATDLRKRWLAEALADVFEQYQQRLALGLLPATPAPHEGWSPSDYEEGVLQVQREWVLAGRALCGEPQNFDY